MAQGTGGQAVLATVEAQEDTQASVQRAGTHDSMFTTNKKKKSRQAKMQGRQTLLSTGRSGVPSCAASGPACDSILSMGRSGVPSCAASGPACESVLSMGRSGVPSCAASGPACESIGSVRYFPFSLCSAAWFSPFS